MQLAVLTMQSSVKITIKITQTHKYHWHSHSHLPISSLPFKTYKIMQSNFITDETSNESHVTDGTGDFYVYNPT